MGDYLKPRRLEEVIRLIQIAGLGPAFGPSNRALERQLHRRPISAPSWVLLAAEHPEFFRTSQTADDPASHSTLARSEILLQN